VLGITDQTDRIVAALEEQTLELEGDLAVAACDDDAHGFLSVGFLSFPQFPPA
jgi:hypothetical protein